MSVQSSSDVIAYLDTHPNFLEDYVTGTKVSVQTFRRWCVKRNHRPERKHFSGPWLVDDLTERQLMLITNCNLEFLLYELSYSCAQMLHIAAFDVIIQKDNKTFVLLRNRGQIELKRFVKHRKIPIHTQKLLDCEGTLFGEILFYHSITDRERVMLNVLCTWGCTAIHYARNFAQKLTNADRASLFLVDHKTKELHARIFDVGTQDNELIRISEDGSKEIRFSADKGISGYVASTGQGVNIENAYDDPRFNKDVDRKTGFKTRNILCMPIFIRGSVIGVMQMVNKANDESFNEHDMSSFEVFAVYCGLALHHAKLYNRIKRSEQKYRVALEVLAYHSVCSKDEFMKIKNESEMEHIAELDCFTFNGLALSTIEKPLYAIYMFKKLFKSVFSYDDDDLVRFVLTVRKNYRQVAYHNWDHGWSVAHAMFVFLRTTNIFTHKEALALYTACICHDLDHRGKNNAFMKSMSTPLAAIYSTSVMEHHHFNQTVTILQQDGHNIFKSLSSVEYKEMLRMIKSAILATDLALFFPNKANLKACLDSGTFDLKNEEHRGLFQAILMTGCDLIAATKSWTVQAETVTIIFEEFYDQGDAERRNDREPIAMMDRRRSHELPKMQVGFMQGICIPCYQLISAVVPSTAELLDRCKRVVRDLLLGCGFVLKRDHRRPISRTEHPLTSDHWE